MIVNVCSFSLYLDGNLLSTEAAAPPATIPAPNKVTPGGHTSAYIGADSSPPTRQPFVGLLAEVRVWDTYRTAIELSSVMHTKLRGNEPDLLAYWNFDYMGLTDNTHGGLDGVLVQAGGSPVADPGAVYWLCDLPFQKPNYPWIETAATCTMVGEETGTLEQRTSTYQMNVTVSR